MTAQQPTVQPASPDQIAAFKMGAAHRYKALGVKPADATRLFDTHMAKMAEEMGIVQKTLSPRAQKVAEALRKTLASKKA